MYIASVMDSDKETDDCGKQLVLWTYCIDSAYGRLGCIDCMSI